MHTFGIKKHPNIFFEKETKDQSFLEKAKTTVSGIAEAMGSDIVDKLKSSVENAKKSNKKSTKDTLKILEATGALVDIGMFDITNKLRLAKRWGEGSGKIGAEKIIEALDKAEKGEVQIVTYSNNTYESWSLKEYENEVNNNTSSMNVSAMKGLYSLRGSGSGFSEVTWSKIGLYIYSYNASGKGQDSRLIKDLDTKSVSDLKILGENMKSKESIKLDIIAKNILEKIQTDRPDIGKLLKNTELQMRPDGNTIDVSSIIASFETNNKKLTIKEIETKFSELAKTMKKNGELLISESKNILKGIPGNPKSLRDIGMSNIPYMRLGKQVDLSDELIANVNPEEAGVMMIAIDMYKSKLDPKSVGYSEILKKIELIQLSLLLSKKGKNQQGTAGQLQITSNLAREQRISGRARSTYTLPDEQVLRVTGSIAISASQRESTQSDLREHGINTLEQAETKLHELEARGRQLSTDEKNLKKLLKQYIRDNGAVARQYQLARETLGNTVAQKIFTQTDQFISGNPNKDYNFNDMEKRAIQANPESTPEDIALAKLKPGESISLQALIEGTMQTSLMNTPEIAGMVVSANPGGTYDIPLIKETHLTASQVKEYMVNIALYADLGLSQFIPHLKLITKKLKSKGVNTSMDGSTGTMEQQNVLKEIYTLLFGKKLETTNLGDVKRAFGSSLGNPENIKNAMQHTLKIHKLIGESGQPIAADTLRNWIQGNMKMTSPSINPFVTV